MRKKTVYCLAWLLMDIAAMQPILPRWATEAECKRAQGQVKDKKTECMTEDAAKFKYEPLRQNRKAPQK